jgi:hypothetical protein
MLAAPVEIRDACLRDASFVAANMRRQDVAEIGAVVDVSNRAGIAATLLMASGFDNPNPNLRWAKIAYIKGQPVAVFGFASAAPHICSAVGLWDAAHGAGDPRNKPIFIEVSGSPHDRGRCQAGRSALARRPRPLT